MPKDSTGFFFDVKAYRGSRSVHRMSMSERGVYLEMMCEQWEKRNLPDDAAQVADAVASTPEQVDEVLAAWPTVRSKFVATKNGKRIYNPRMERTRRQQAANRRKHQENGSKGGKAKALKTKPGKDIPPSDARASPGIAVADSTDKTGLDLTRPDWTGPDVTGQEIGKSSGADAAIANLSVITKIAHEVRDLFPNCDYGDWVEGVKDRCAKRKINYDAAVVRKAVESAEVQAKAKRAS